MKQSKLAQALCLGLAMSCVSTAALADGPDPDRVWVKFKPGTRGQVEQALQRSGGRVHHVFDGLDAIAVSLPPQALQGIQNNPNVEYIEPDVVRRPMGQVRPYGIDLVQAPQVWAGGTDGSGMKVCVIDSGIHAGHEDFQGVNLAGGYPATWNTDTCGHGSHVAGTIAAKDNSSGVVGVNTGNLSLFIVKVFDGASCGWSYSSTLVDAANRCAGAGAKVINMSLGGSTSSTTEKNAFQSLYNAGVLSIAAAGNDGNTRHSYPASYDSVVSVAAVDSNKQHADFSQRTSQVELAAPGVGVLSTVPFVTASLNVAGSGYLAEALELTYQGTASGALVNGGRCTSTGAWAGKVVLCERGDISFADKVNNVFASGGVGTVIYNNAPGGFSGTLGTAGPAIPAVSIAQEDGQYLVANRIGSSATVSTVANNQGSGYAYYDGTSMATPHVAGVAALIWSANPTWTNQEVRDALAATAEDLGTAGRDASYGWGLIRAQAALDSLQGNNNPPPAVFELTGRIQKIKGVNKAVLSWTGGSTANVTIKRNGATIATVANSGGYTDGTSFARGTTVTYQVCEQGSSVCTNSVSLTF